jgi:hypothetical protein
MIAYVLKSFPFLVLRFTMDDAPHAVDHCLMRIALHALGAGCIGLFLAAPSLSETSPSKAATSPVQEDETVRNAQSDFDFFFGRWKVRNRRLREPLQGSNLWDEFEGIAVVQPILGGKGNVNDFEAQGPSGLIQGFALRLFNPRSQEWSIYWASGDRGTLDLPPMIGSFRDGRGEFYNQETFEGRGIFVRFVWSGITATSCRWEQAFSADGGRTWETNWIMEFTRSEADAAEPLAR